MEYHRERLVKVFVGERWISFAGFTLLELLVVLAIVAIVSTMSLPSFVVFVQREKLEAVSEEFSASIVVARSAAVKSGVPVILCASSSGSSCTGDWSDGWIVFVDEDRDRDADTAEPVLLRRGNDPERMQISVATLAAADVNLVGFNYRGAPDSALLVTVTNGDQVTTTSVTAFGKPRRNE